ncbi:vomeronasal type-1 receptor 41-like [Dipodomys spectabilis]|uniref:vomeronasal type-1 receptor 41-like n=1 Tax=Dipodomys spectabilis TaxID=105255 RepID=UPI001C536370|nr:vomeronasal type-1 receptor 41-like [Dipodomys spectabilis]
MFSSASIWGLFLIAQLCVGVMGNSLLFVLHLYTFLFQSHLKNPINAIFMHLTVVNILNLTFTMLPDIMAYFRFERFLDDVGCKAVVYLYRVTRGLSICTTSLLSVFQAITISSNCAYWVWLKSKSSVWIFSSFLFFCIINMVIYFPITESLRAKSNFTLVGSGFSNAYCQAPRIENNRSWYFISILLFRDLVFVILMITTSLYMVTLLYRHHKTTRHLHSPRLASQSAPENKAIHTILLLVSCFVFFYCFNNIANFYSFHTAVKIPTLDVIICIVSSCYPTVCPFFLMKNNKILSKCKLSLSLIGSTGCHKAFNG